jgi:hypothetical protein
MFHPEKKAAQRQRISGGAATLLGMADRKTDDKDVRDRALARWKRAGGFATDSLSNPYFKQQQEAARQVPNLLMVGDILELVWAMQVHHETALNRGRASASRSPSSSRAARLSPKEQSGQPGRNMRQLHISAQPLRFGIVGRIRRAAMKT